MSESLVEDLRLGGRVQVALDNPDYRVDVTAERVWVHGCDCSSRMTAEQIRQVHAALGAWLRIHREPRSVLP